MRLPLLFAVLAPAAALTPLAGRVLPLFEVRQVPHQLHAGALLPGEPVAQHFATEPGDLRRVEVNLAPLAPEVTGTLELRLTDLEGAILRRRQVDVEARDPGGWLGFDLEPFEVTDGRMLRFELEAVGAEVPLTPHVRYRGSVHAVILGGDRHIVLPELERTISSRGPDLTGVAIPYGDLDRAAGIPRLFVLGSEGTPVREATASPDRHTRGGHEFFSFAPIRDTRMRDIAVVLDNPGLAQVEGRGDGFAYATLHRRGTGRATPAAGAELRGAMREDLDLVCRVFVDGAPDALNRARARLGVRGWAVLVLLILAALALGRAVATLAAPDR